jgi:ABC-type antimicrobial peptide transport system permease subunit
MALVASTASEDAASVTPRVREVVGRLDPELPLYGVQTMAERVEESLTSRRVPLMLLGTFAAVALFLAAVGIYGALAYTVTQRTREIGIRMAMGSSPSQVFRTVVGGGLRVTAAGLLLGGATAYVLSSLIESLLFGVRPTDAGVIAGVATLLAVVACVACVIPARRATRVNPVEALGG